MQTIYTTILFLWTGIKALFTPPMTYYTLLGIAGGLIALIKKRNA